MAGGGGSVPNAVLEGGVGARLHQREEPVHPPRRRADWQGGGVDAADLGSLSGSPKYSMLQKKGTHPKVHRLPSI